MQLHTPRILWFAMLVTMLMFTAVAFLAAPQDLTISPVMLTMLGVMAVGNSIGGFVVGMWLRRQAYTRAKFEVVEVPDTSAETMFRDAPPMVREFANPEKVRSKLMALSQTPFILELALSESVGIFGMVAAMLGAEPLTWLPFIAVSAVLIAVRLPTEKRFIRAVERVYDARMP